MIKRRSFRLEELGTGSRLARPQLERLEAREAPAANLGATLGAGVLHISEAVSSGQIVVQESQQQLSITGTTIAVGQQSLSSVPVNQVSQITVTFGATTRSFTQIQGLPANTLEVEDLTTSGKVDTLYTAGKPYQQSTFDSSGNLVKLTTWNTSGEVDTFYKNGQPYQQNTFDAAGNAIETVTWSASGKVATFNQHGSPYLQNTYDASGATLLSDCIAWSSFPARSIRCTRTARPISRTRF